MRRVGRTIGCCSTVLLGTVILISVYSRFANPVSNIPSAAVGTEWFSGTVGSDEVVRSVAEETATSLPAVIVVNATGDFAERLHQFIVRLSDIRRRMWQRRGYGAWKNEVYSKPVQVLSGARDDYLNVLAAKYPHVTTVVLPWISTGDSVWNSLTDTTNVPRQTYVYEWTADDMLCTWIESPNVRYGNKAVFNRTCIREINATASTRALRPIYLNAKPLQPHKYWPNDGSAYPAHFYASPPPFVFYIHIHRDAVVTTNGDVFSGNLKLVLDACSDDMRPKVSDGDRMKLYDEVLVIAQNWGHTVYHRMIEVMPRVVFYREFLRENPQIRVVAPEPRGGRLSELLRIIDVDDTRLVVGPVRAKVVYQPRSSKCFFPSVQECRTLSALYRDYIRRTFLPQPRNRLLLIRRSGVRRFQQQKAIEELMERAADDYNLTYTLFVDNPTPSLNDTMMMFHSAVIVVAPLGAGESNLLFSQPGTYVVEGVCNLPLVNLCFQRLAHILGHHWYGLMSRRGCPRVVDVSAASVNDAVRSHLRLWTLERSSDVSVFAE